MTDKITLVWRSDVHVSDNPPVSRIDDWNTTLMGKLGQVGDIARDVGAAAVLDGGDFFHVKSPGRNAHRTLQKVAKVHNKYPCPVYANIGNHDCKYGDYSHLPEQPLGVLFETGVFQRCYDEYEVYIWRDGGAFQYTSQAPSQVVEGPLIRVVGIPYHGTEYDMDRFTSIQKGGEDHLVVMAHVLASKKGGTMFEGEDIVKYSELAKLPPDIWLMGHWHKNQGIEEIASGKWVGNIGSLSRGSLSQDDLKRTPSTIVLTFTKGHAKLIERPLRVAPPDEVFDLVGKTRREAKDMTMEAFVGTLKASLQDEGHPPISDVIRGIEGAPSVVKERALWYWENQG